MMTDPIADLLARIRNAQTARHENVTIPHSKIKLGIVKALYEEGFLGPYRVTEQESGKKVIQITIRYVGRHQGLISGLSRESRPGRRVYLGYEDIRPIRSGMGVSVLSTPKGILTDKQARDEKVGGELLCRVW